MIYTEDDVKKGVRATADYLLAREAEIRTSQEAHEAILTEAQRPDLYERVCAFALTKEKGAKG